MAVTLWMAYEVADFVVRDFERAFQHVDDIKDALLWYEKGNCNNDNLSDDAVVVDIPPWFQLDSWFARGLLFLMNSPFGRNDCGIASDEIAVLAVIGHYGANAMHGAARKWFCASQSGMFADGSWRARMFSALLDM